MSFFPEEIPLEKRGTDLLFSSISLVILSPLLLITSIAVWVSYGLPILFRQQRPGYQGKPFIIFKFRTMADEIDSQGNYLPMNKG